MSTTQPVRDDRKLERLKGYYQSHEPNIRNYSLIILGLNTALRISDILQVKWGDIYDFDTDSMKTHLEMKEQKTGKTTRIALNKHIKQTFTEYLKHEKKSIPTKETFLFPSRMGENQPLSRYQAYRVIKKAAVNAGYPEHISCHSLRKTFGYHAWKQGVQPAMLMNIYNHSSYRITKRYLGIEQDDRDDVFLKIQI